MKTANFARQTLPFSLSPFPLCLLALLFLAPAGLFVPAARAAEDLSAILQRGLFEEEANHDLPAAIKAYEAVVNSTDAQRKLAGTALFRLAECQRKLGRTNDAMTLYQRVLREYPDQARLTELSKANLASSGRAEAGSTPASERVQLLERRLADEEQEFYRLNVLYRSLTNLSRAELKKVVPTTAPDPLLTTLMQQRVTAEQRLAELGQNFSPKSPEVLAADSSLKTVDRQIEERIDGIVAGIALKVESQKAAVNQATKSLEDARASAGVPMLSQSARAEQKRLLEEEIKLVENEIEKERAAQDKLRQAGVQVDYTASLSTKQREVLALRRQLAALSEAPAAANTTFQERLNAVVQRAAADGNNPEFQERLNAIIQRASGTPATPTDEEDKEVRRIQALIKDSPDLINAGDQGGNTPLHAAAAKGQLVVARFLLTNNANINARSKFYTTPLMDAVTHGHKSMTELLLANGADVNASGSEGTPLHSAAGRGYKAIAEVLLANKANPNALGNNGETPLHSAVRKGFQSVAELLLEAGANVNVVEKNNSIADKNTRRIIGNPEQYAHDNGTPLHIAVYIGSKPITELILARKPDVNLRNQFGETPLHLVGNRVDLAALLVAAKADVNARIDEPGNELGKTPLAVAVTGDHADMVEFLLKNGADPNLRFDKEKQYTAVAAAVDRGSSNERILRALLEHKADTEARTWNGLTPLQVALYQHNKPAAEQLLKHGADVEVRDRERGNTLLCGMWGGTENAELLLRYKADPNAQNNEGETPLHTLVRLSVSRDPSSQKELAELLIGRGADVNRRNRQGQTALNLYGVPARPRNPEAIELAEVLRKHGAKDEQLDLPADPDSIRVWRKGLTSGRVVFVRDEAGRNRFTLLEALMNFYSLRQTPDTAAPRTVQTRALRNTTPAQPGLPPPPINPRANVPVTGVPGPSFPGQYAGVSVVGGAPATAFGGMPLPTYDPLNEFSYPDLTRIRILRLTNAEKNEKKVISVNLLNAAGIVLCENDVLLEFGDIIEIPEREYRLEEGRVGLNGDQQKQFGECMPRKVRVAVKDESTDVSLWPQHNMAYLATVMTIPAVRNLLRSTSDLSRLRITRRGNPALDQKAMELTVDLEAFKVSGKQKWDDLWLRDGDVVEVPEKE